MTKVTFCSHVSCPELLGFFPALCQSKILLSYVLKCLTGSCSDIFQIGGIVLLAIGIFYFVGFKHLESYTGECLVFQNVLFFSTDKKALHITGWFCPFLFCSLCRVLCHPVCVSPLWYTEINVCVTLIFECSFTMTCACMYFVLCTQWISLLIFCNPKRLGQTNHNSAKYRNHSQKISLKNVKDQSIPGMGDNVTASSDWAFLSM